MLNVIFSLMAQLMKRTSSPKSMGLILLLGSILALIMSNFSVVVGWFGYETRDVLNTKIVKLENGVDVCNRTNSRIMEEFDIYKINSLRDYLSLKSACESEIEKLNVIIKIENDAAIDRSKLKNKIEIVEESLSVTHDEGSTLTTDKEIQTIKYDSDKLDEQSIVNLRSIQTAYDSLLGEFL